MMSVVTVAILYLSISCYIIRVGSQKSNQSYKISMLNQRGDYGQNPQMEMNIWGGLCPAVDRDDDVLPVSSDTNPGRPAMFEHGESPVWDPASQSLYFVDVRKQNVHRFDYNTGRIYTKHIGYGQVNVVSLVANSSRLLVAVRSALYLLDWGVEGDAALRLLTTVDQGMPDNVINDGKPGPGGRFWGGTKGPQSGDNVVPDKAVFFSVSQECFTSPRLHLKPVTISNGLAWAPNNSVFYYIDSPTRKVEAFDFDAAKGEISKRRTIVDIRNYGYKEAIPDGMTIDGKGNLWVALMFGGTVLHINPDSRSVINAYQLPAKHITSVCWGGPYLDELFVTSGRDESTPEPYAGAIFRIRATGIGGLPPYKFHFDNADSY